MSPDDPATVSEPVRWSASTEFKDMWVDPADDPRDTGEDLPDERSVLVMYLRAYRLTLEMKCAGLDDDALARRSCPPSNLSLLGLLRHLAETERYWFREVMAGQDVEREVGEDNDAFEDALADPEVVAKAWEAWRSEVAFAEQLVSAISDMGTLRQRPDGSSLQLREVLVHMIEEYARHAGHADLLRERIDGRVGQ